MAILANSTGSGYLPPDRTSTTNASHAIATQPPALAWRLSSDLMCVTAIFTNLAFLIAVYADRTSKAGPRLLIGNLALCGSIFASSLFPVFIIQNWLPPSYIPSQCDLVSASIFFMTVISWADVCLAINRTVAICFPYHYDAFRRRRVTWSLISASWTISITIAVLVRTETGVTFMTIESGACSMVVVSPFAQFYVSLCTIVPYLILGGASAGIFSTAYIRLRRPPDNMVEALKMKRLIQRRLVVAKAMAISLVWNVLCSLPTLLILSAFPTAAKSHPWLNNFITFSMDILYTINPVIYFWVSPAYRQSFLRVTFYRFCAPCRQFQVDTSSEYSKSRTTQKRRRTLASQYDSAV